MRPEIFPSGSVVLQEKMEDQYKKELPYFLQSFSWKEGMTYKYSPDFYPLNRKQLETLRLSGQAMGEYLSEYVRIDNLLEFRLDFVCDWNGKLFITEAQTDDRGLPAVATTRNARVRNNPGIFPGVDQAFMNALEQKSGKDNPNLAIIYPDEERFYYAGFYDFAKLTWERNPKSNILVAPRSAIGNDNGVLDLKVPFTGYKLQDEPDFIWDFSLSLPDSQKLIQPLVNKQPLLDIWNNQDEKTARLRQIVPRTLPIRDEEVKKEKNKWILKPLNGRWSKGVVIGRNVSAEEWEKAGQSEEKIVAQEFIDPRVESFYVRNKKGKYERNNFFARVEGYYCMDKSGWKLADVLATCTPDLPVHGKRDCIMIPGKVI